MSMMYTRALYFRYPLMRGEDVLAVQSRLTRENAVSPGKADGLFGWKTDRAVRAFQQSKGLRVDGIVGPLTWRVLFKGVPGSAPEQKIGSVLDELKTLHGYRDSEVAWRLDKKGLYLKATGDGANGEIGYENTGGEPSTVRRVWERFGESVERWATGLGVPAELIVATICTETRGDPDAVREEPGYQSDERTPAKVSPGLMQTLISTARDVLGDDSIDRAWLLLPDNSIRAGTAYIAQQWMKTHFDPPKVACAYNAGGIYYNKSTNNRWRMRQYPINSSHHADRFTEWFNDCFRMFEADNVSPGSSFYALV